MQTRYPEDNTGKVYRVRARHARNPTQLQRLRLLQNPGQHRCLECNGETFYVIADQAPTGLLVLQCANAGCHCLVGPMELHVPQMSDSHAKELGLVLPGDGPQGTIDFDL